MKEIGNGERDSPTEYVHRRWHCRKLNVRRQLIVWSCFIFALPCCCFVRRPEHIWIVRIARRDMKATRATNAWHVAGKSHRTIFPLQSVFNFSIKMISFFFLSEGVERMRREPVVILSSLSSILFVFRMLCVIPIRTHPEWQNEIMEKEQKKIMCKSN